MHRWLVMVVCLVVSPLALVAGEIKKSDSVVKVSATGDKPSDGKQVVTLTLKIDKGWHVYANPVGNDDLVSAQTTVTATSAKKLESVKVDYPTGQEVIDKVVGNYMTYEDTVKIKITVQRAKGDDGPLEVTVKFQSCSKDKCLLPAAVKVNVPEK